MPSHTVLGRLSAACPRVVAATVAGLLLAGCGSDASTTPRPAKPGANVGTALDGPISDPIARLPLTDQNGDPTRLADYRGKVVVVVPGMTLCQETCPLDVATSVRALRAINRAGLADQVELLTVTVDPWRDTARRMRAYRRLYAPPANWDAVTGSPQQLQRFWHYFGVFRHRVRSEPGAADDWLTGRPLRYDVQHSDEVFFLDQSLHERFILEGPGNVAAPGDVPARIRRFLNDKGRQNLAHPGHTTWTVSQVLQVVAWLTHHPIAGAAGQK